MGVFNCEKTSLLTICALFFLYLCDNSIRSLKKKKNREMSVFPPGRGAGGPWAEMSLFQCDGHGHGLPEVGLIRGQGSCECSAPSSSQRGLRGVWLLSRAAIRGRHDFLVSSAMLTFLSPQ